MPSVKPGVPRELTINKSTCAPWNIVSDTYIYIYIYIYNGSVIEQVLLCVPIYICIYIYRETDRQTQSD